MSSIGLSVPPGLTISIEACQEYQQNGKNLPEGLWEEILEGLKSVEEDMGAILGDLTKPLFLSVRSEAAISMPGMMDTVLNLELNDEVVAGLAAKNGERFAYDSYRCFLDTFGDVVMGIPHSLFEEMLENMKEAKEAKLDTDLIASDLKELVEQYKHVYFEAKVDKFPSGVLFARNPSTGEKKLYGEFLVKAQDIEFTVQENRLWILQCRSGKRTGKGGIKIAVDMVKEGLVDKRTAIKMMEPHHLDQLLHPQFEDPSAYKDKVVAMGLPASPGAAVGQIVFSADDAEQWHAQGKSVILVRTETSPEDVGGKYAAAGILTARGGKTSHAAVVARGWGKCCVSGCANIRVNDAEKVMANADISEDALAARNNGAQGICLCRTEHMFFASDERIKAVRKMIMAVTPEQRKAALDGLLPYQRSDFEGIFRAMDGQIAKESEFFSFGTNDLTQMTFGYNRDDVDKFLPIHLSKGILQSDPFDVLDQTVVGQLIKIATEKGRGARPSLKASYFISLSQLQSVSGSGHEILYYSLLICNKNRTFISKLRCQAD
ncbi:hypothetical protein DITRI_Ditri08aG0021100 [Diplodiscus trichospermus]